MATDREIFVHAGAHRTGTSSFQQCLSDNREALKQAGYICAYPGRDGVPGGRLKLRLPRKRHGAQRVPKFSDLVAQHLEQVAPAAEGKLILSEENLPGLMRNFYDGLFMAGSRNRLAALRQGLGVAPRHVIYVVRSYEALFVSAYRKRAEDNPVPPFADLRKTFMGMDRGWPGVITDLQDMLGAARLTVVDYAARGSSVDLLRRLVPGLETVDLQEPERAMNLSATDAALEALQARYRADESLARPDWQAVIAAHAQDTDPRGFAEFPDADATTLRARYHDDLAVISGLQGVDLIA